MNENILVVDDNIENLKTLEAFFIKEGFDVRCAPNGKTALMLAQNKTPSLILLDIHMPEMNGFELCTEIKKNPFLENIPILFISAETSTDEKLKAFQFGAVDYITKPFQFEETLARVKTHIRIMTLQNELAKKNDELEISLLKLEETQEQLIQSSKLAALGTLIAGVTHEINNPLNYIITGIPALEGIMRKLKSAISIHFSEKKDEENENRINSLTTMMEEILTNIKTGALKTAEIVKGLKNFSRVDTAETNSVVINQCIDFALLILENQLNNDIIIDKKFGNLPVIKGYEGKLEQVFVNILKNSIDAVKSKTGEMKITIVTALVTCNNTQCISIIFQDTGGGIQPEIIDKIFDPFFSTKEVGHGTGLGLSISYNIIQNHGGTITVNNNSDGAVFEIILPINRGEIQ
ncbi:MAG: hypothetical protein A2015_15980 [Spirochaetes bacterium GWF1_31_7]|nr:MAG: hypothetical protein A2Y30_13355 [Spirochaetes bacterium GWE1_32_154]OHD49953.1 MAG: hypothetical protein A2Y29_11400 [Spirochaetes bacterium GWE2_31_10]OHD52270.1 MAG: hypothetical protein A2015_15980 [Spirochaetes bacterium GWF1_31_7]HBD96455.1 hypothetical protein [Spirochaetia bacterium]HBI38412.1 hypothetical protein [Spirochaetia bacterium]